MEVEARGRWRRGPSRRRRRTPSPPARRRGRARRRRPTPPRRPAGGARRAPSPSRPAGARSPGTTPIGTPHARRSFTYSTPISSARAPMPTSAAPVSAQPLVDGGIVRPAAPASPAAELDRAVGRRRRRRAASSPRFSTGGRRAVERRRAGGDRRPARRRRRPPPPRAPAPASPARAGWSASVTSRSPASTAASASAAAPAAEPRQQPGRDLRLDHRRRRDEAAVLLGDQRQVEQRRTPATVRLVDGHRDDAHLLAAAPTARGRTRAARRPAPAPGDDCFAYSAGERVDELLAARR